VFSGVFVAEEVEKGSGDTTTIDVQTLGGLVEHIPDICLFH
jgi:hypothetical protein